MIDRHSARLGLWAATLVALLVAAFGISLLAGLLIPHLAGGGLTASFVASFLLAPAFVAMMVCIAVSATPRVRVWGHLGVAFASIYAVMVTTTYYLQLAVLPRAEEVFSAEIVTLLTFAPGTPLFALDMLGYAFMTLATLSAAPVFEGPGLNAWIRGWFVAHGFLGVPTLLAPVLFIGPVGGASDLLGSLVLIGWSVFFLPLAVLVGFRFRQMAAQGPALMADGPGPVAEPRSAL
jgi:hypothetical protein